MQMLFMFDVLPYPILVKFVLLMGYLCSLFLCILCLIVLCESAAKIYW
jgi:hypothetical protein